MSKHHRPPASTKRKADVTFADDDDDDERDDVVSSSAAEEEEEEDFLPDSVATKKTTTPGGVTPSSKATPGSSGGSGMRMRSGRKKKRGNKSTTTAAAAAAAASLEAEEDGSNSNNATVATQRLKRARKKNHGTMTPHPNGNDEMEDGIDDDIHMDNVDDDEEKKMDDDYEIMDDNDDEGSDEEDGTATTTTTTTTARKVPPEVTLEAIAAAQVADDDEDDEEIDEGEETIDDDDDDVDIKDIPPPAVIAAATDGGIGNSNNNHVGRLFSNFLMSSSSSSSSTGMGAASAAAAPPPPPPGRRLIFETAQKQQQQTSRNISNSNNGQIHRNNRFLSSQTRRTPAATPATTTTITTKKVTTPLTHIAKNNNLRQQKQHHHHHHREGVRIESTSTINTIITPQYNDELLLLVYYYIKNCFHILLSLCLIGNIGISLLLLGNRNNNNSSNNNESIVGFRGVNTIFKHVNIMDKGVQWGKWYNIIVEEEEERSVLEVNVNQDYDEDEDEEDNDDDTMLLESMSGEVIVQKTVTTVTDPIQLDNARTEMMSHYTLVHEIEKQTQIANTYRDSIAEIDDILRIWMKEYPDIDFEKLVINDDNNNEILYSNDRSNRIQANIVMEQQRSLLEWESALSITEDAVNLLTEGKINPLEMNDELTKLAILSKIPIEARVLGTIHVPGEGCEDMDYIPLERDAYDDEIVVDDDDVDDVVGRIKIGALDPASNIPIHFKHIQTIKEELLLLTQQMLKELPELDITRVQSIIHDELQEEGVDEGLPSIDDLHKPITIKMIDTPSSMLSSMMHDGVYTAHDAVNDIDRIFEKEDADLTGKYDYALIINGAKVLRRGPFATSSSLYETLPLLNRILAYTKLRFYGHPPEVALLPTSPINARGQCWSFPNESTNALSRHRVVSTSGIAKNDLLGLYATLSVRLASAVSVTEIMVEHNPTVIPHESWSSSSSAIKHFRVLGFEDGGAFGDPWELGSFTFIPGSSMSQTTFSIPAMLDGQRIPKMKVISIAVDSNGGASYSCLYRVRVHGV